jgi:hypothetical protein
VGHLLENETCGMKRQVATEGQIIEQTLDKLTTEGASYYTTHYSGQKT